MGITIAKNLSDQVYDIIMERIFSGEYKQGDKLSVNKLAQEFNISRSPVNDALQKLSGACIVEMNKNSCCTIRTLSVKQIKDLIEFRKAIELYVCENAFDILVKESCTALKSISRESSSLPQDGSYQNLLRFFDLDEKFHQVFVAALGNEYVSEDYSRANKLLRLVSIQMTDARNASNNVLWEHDQIISALEQNDYNALRNAISCHLSLVCERMIKGTII